MGALTPLSICGPSGSTSKKPSTRRWAASLLTRTPRGCKGVQSCGNIGRFANDAVTKALLANAHFADHDRASVDTAAGFETGCPKLRQSGHDVEAGLDCTLSGVLMGPRITEIGGHSVADEKADLPFMTLNHLCAH